MSAPKKFTVALKGKQRQRGTRAERALLRLYFMAGGFNPDTADASVFRWAAADDPKEFEAKLGQAVAWAEIVELRN